MRYYGPISDNKDLVTKEYADRYATRYATITLPVASWAASGDNYIQTVTVSGYTVTANTMVDLQASPAVVAQLVADEVNALTIVNNNGTLTATSVGAAPTAALSVQVILKEVTAV